jgi:hypothetical protein
VGEPDRLAGQAQKWSGRSVLTLELGEVLMPEPVDTPLTAVCGRRGVESDRMAEYPELTDRGVSCRASRR